MVTTTALALGRPRVSCQTLTTSHRRRMMTQAMLSLGVVLVVEVVLVVLVVLVDVAAAAESVR